MTPRPPAQPPGHYQLGRAPTPAELRGWDIDVAPDGAGLPAGSGTVAQGRELFAQRCVACHGDAGKGGPGGALAGGQGSLTSKKPVKTVGSFWPYATTLYDYINRAMPWDAPQSLNPNQVYALTAYVLHVNGIVGADTVMDARSLPAVKMPNRDGFTLFTGRDIAPQACMRDCR
ncbi:MAG: c-type cytochrome [Burkholderiaceae bacterium]